MRHSTFTTYIKHFDRYLLGSLGLFSLLLLPFLSAIPYMDGNIDFVQSNDFYIGGIDTYFQNWGSVHPPFKLWLTNLFYTLFGVHPLSYNLLGFIFGIIGITALYGLTKTLSDKSTARVSALLLATSGMFLACGLFSMRDFILTSLILVALYFYSNARFLSYAITASAVILTKETSLLLPISILTVELFYLFLSLFRKDKTAERYQQRFFKQASKGTRVSILNIILYFLYLLLPIITFITWLAFLQMHHQKPWSDWLFTSTASKGTFYTIFYNLVTFSFLNQYGYQQWLHLFVLNFNWVYWSIVCIGLFFLIRRSTVKDAMKSLLQGNIESKTILSMVLFFFIYFFSVLTIQTYTIPRYILPLIPFLLLTVALMIINLSKQIPSFAGILGGILCIAVLISLFFSVDPLSQMLWGNIQVFDQTIYGMNSSLSGNDGITYNMQYLLIASERTKYLYSSPHFPQEQYFRSSCDWMLKDPNNDLKTIHILGLHNFPFITACTQQTL